MKTRLSGEFIYQIFALLVSVIIVHAAYVTVVRPMATKLEAENQAQILADAGSVRF